MKKRALEAAYDEASSSGESDEYSSEEEVVDGGSQNEDSDSDDTSDSDSKSSNKYDKDDNDDSDGEDEQDSVARDSNKDSASEDEEDEFDVPLSERIQRKQARGLSLHTKRERKRNALEVASERLAQLKQSKKEEIEVRDRKKSKHAPTEVSSKRSDFYRRGFRLNESGLGVEIGANRYKPLDPRTSSLSGHLNEEQFEKNYEFLQEMRSKEISKLKKQITARKQTGKKGKRMRRLFNVSRSEGTLEDDEQHLKQLKQEKADFERRKIVRAAKQAVKKKIQTEVEEGKRGAYFLKRKEKKRLEFEAKIEELRKRGGHKAVEKALAKKRQKAKSRDAGLFVK